LTKLDGTAKGGMVFAIYQELKLPVRFIGTGEKSKTWPRLTRTSLLTDCLNNFDAW
jgi:signal recognition particle GTPase